MNPTPQRTDHPGHLASPALSPRVRLMATWAPVLFLLWPGVALVLEPAVSWAVPVGLTGLTLFGALLALVLHHNMGSPHSARAPSALVVLVVIAIALVPVIGPVWLLTASYVLVAVGVLTLSARWWPVVLGAVLASDALALMYVLDSPDRLPGVLAQIGVFGLLMMAAYRMVRLNEEVIAVRARLVRAAATEERLRIARDMHDVLGQRLSQLSLQSELARRLLRTDPDRADGVLTEVSRVTRQTLGEVRRTLSGYRSPSLHGELEAAEALLDGAGITLVREISGDPLSDRLDTCAAWLVREGVTNVVRHSRARTCTIRISSEHTGTSVWVADDGPDQDERPPGPLPWGLGLSGLHERVVAEGGYLEIEPGPPGFVLHAHFPLEER